MPSPAEVKALLEKFQETLAKWPRDGGLFIDLMGEKLKQIEQNFAKDVVTQLPAGTFNKNENNKSVDTGQTEVYVELYQMNGDNMDRWATTLNSIAIQGISRPIYQTEADVCAMIRNKEQKIKEGYAVVKIASTDIVTPPRPLQDKDARPLLHVKPGSLKPENIVKFVHFSGQYLWQNGTLIKLDLPSPIREKS